MIDDLDKTIKTLLVKKGAIEPSQVDIKFETPDREWSASLSKPTINIYLYDMRENHQLRGTEWLTIKNDDGTSTKKKNPNRLDVSYIVTVWANDASDEHKLLWRVMATLFKYPVIPDDVLTGELKKQITTIKASTSQPNGLFSNPSDFWSALDNKIKASINYVVTLPLDSDLAFTAPDVITKVIDVKPPEAEADRIIQVGGLVTREGKAAEDLSNARVLAKEAKLTAKVDEKGAYSFRNINSGKHTFQVIVDGKAIKDIKITIPGDNYDLAI